MAIKNPYGVGDSGPGAREIKVQCTCCRLPFLVTAGPRTPIVNRVCRSCKSHDLDGSVEERALALEDHAERSRDLADRALEQLRSGMAERDEALAERKRFGQMLYRSNEDLDYLRRQLSAIWGVHVETPSGRCSCGETPCPTRDAANQVADSSDWYRTHWLSVPPRL